jgi:two-component system, response regulator PdtaR
MPDPLRLLVVEDEVLLLMQIEAVLAREGHVVVGTALSSREAMDCAAACDADVALVDIHLADGLTGLDVARFVVERTGMAVVFMTANPKQVPADFPGALGTIAKPYSQAGLCSALAFVAAAIRHPPPPALPPRSLTLAPVRDKRAGAAG